MALVGMDYGHIAPVYQDARRTGDGLVTPVVPDRPARVQVEQLRKLQQVEHAGEFNIWYGKYMGESSYEKAARASTRVCLETDAGLTRADYTSNTNYICLHFARGCCVYGKDCTFRHCAPTEEDESSADAPHDIFGRDRHGSFRDDMGGVGTWTKDCKTLYVGRMCARPSEEAMTEILVRHMGEFGRIESCRVLRGKGCGFVTYHLRATAEFAKEAMAEQTLDHDEQINVRWAYDDPNPRAQAVRLRNSAQQMLAAMEAKGHLSSGAAAYPEDFPTPDEADEADEPGAAGSAEYEAAAGGASVAKRARVSEPVPMTREQWAAQQAAEAAAAEAAAAEAAAAEAAAEAEAARQQAMSTASRLEAILNSLISASSGAAASDADASHTSAVVSGAVAGSAGSGSGADTVTIGADPLSSFLHSLESGGGGGGGGAADGGAPASASAVPGALDDTVDLPPGVSQRRLPPGWREFLSPEGHPYYVSPEGQSTWARP